jgi:Phage integrase, N-terminal SAM-like domain
VTKFTLNITLIVPKETDLQWIRRYILFHNKRHPKDMGIPEIETVLSHLTIDGPITASTQKQALSSTEASKITSLKIPHHA